MTAKNTNLQGTGPVLRKRAIGLMAWLACAMPFAAGAANVLQDINFVPGEAGRVDITLQLAEPSSDAQVFTTDQPPRIAIDLPDTRNAVAQRRMSVGQGSTSAISAVEAAGRTRVVIDLFRSASYETRTEGSNLIISVAAGTAGSSDTKASTASAGTQDPSKRIAGSMELANVDFRRAPDGAGRVVLTFNGDNAGADLRTEGSRVIIDLPGILVPAAQVQKLDVIDFATPVQTVEASAIASGGRITLTTDGAFESMAYQTGNEYVVEISAPKAGAGSANAASMLADDEETFVGKPVTFNFQDIPVRTVLQLIAEESGLNVVAADTVTGNVTLRLINVPWDQALNIVLRAKGLDQRREGNVVWVAPQPEIASYEQAKADARLALEQRAELVTEYIPINYGSAEEVARLLTEDAKQSQGAQGAGGSSGQNQQQRGFLSPRGSVSFDKRTNTLLLNETHEKIAELRELIALLDRPVDQVLIEARIVIANENFARELGARFGVSSAYEDGNNLVTTSGSLGASAGMANSALNNRRDGTSNGLPVTVPSLTDRLNVNLPVISPAGAVGFTILSADHLIDLELSALETEGRGELVSSPRVITANQRPATITQGDEIGYQKVNTTVSPPTVDVEFKQVLMELKATPTITQDGRIFLNLDVKKDQVSGIITTPQGQIPQIAKRSVSTAVLVDDGQTVVIGGVYEFTSQEDVRKVPFLGDVPFLGNLFKTKGRSSEKAELLIFITPKILAVRGAENSSN
jgi:type IV pilus assembly protein PilQ